MDKVNYAALDWYREHREEIERERRANGDIGAYYLCYLAGWNARKKAEADPLDEVLNSGDGVYRP